MTDRERAKIALRQVYLTPAAYEATVQAIEAQLAAARADERELVIAEVRKTRRWSPADQARGGCFV